MKLKNIGLLAALVMLVELAAWLPGTRASMNALPATASRPAVQEIVYPKITRAVIDKKDLVVEGENFAAGAKLLLNGSRALKVQNDAASPSTKLIVKKGRNLLPEDEMVILQVKNPDDRASDAFGFFTGLTLTYHNTYNGDVTALSVGQIFLVNFDDIEVGLGWLINDYGNYTSGAIEVVTMKVPLLPNAQGLFLAKQSGRAFIRLAGFPLTQPSFLWLVNLGIK